MSRSLLSIMRLSFLLLILNFIVGCSSSPGSNDDYSPPDTPSLSANAHNGSVTLTWPAVNKAVSYKLYWSMTQQGTREMSAPIPVTGLTYNHEGRNNGQTYYYALTALSEHLESEKSVEIAAIPIPPPDPPQYVRAILQEGAATVSWEPTPSATQYNLYISSDSKLNAENITHLADGMVFKNVSNPYSYGSLDNKTYYFAVSAVNPSGESGLSGIASATPEQLARLLIAHTQNDRVNPGALYAAFECGIITAIVRRAQALVEG